MEPLVSVCIFTYNHESLIEQCIESALMQKTNFDYEIVIGEDYSNDRTKQICLKYEQGFPGIVRVLDRGKNLGMCNNIFKTLQECKGEYIALLDGDDYWIDPLCLQKKYDYLETNKEMNLVFNQSLVINELDNSLYYFVKNKKEQYSVNDLINKWSMATASMFFRSKAMDYPDFVYHTHNFDLIIQLIVNRNDEKIGYIDDLMSVYRINEGSNTNDPNYNAINTLKRKKILFNEFNEYTKFKFNSVIQKKLYEMERERKNLSNISISKALKKVIKNVFNSMGFDIHKYHKA